MRGTRSSHPEVWQCVYRDWEKSEMTPFQFMSVNLNLIWTGMKWTIIYWTAYQRNSKLYFHQGPKQIQILIKVNIILLLNYLYIHKKKINQQIINNLSILININTDYLPMCLYKTTHIYINTCIWEKNKLIYIHYIAKSIGTSPSNEQVWLL